MQLKLMFSNRENDYDSTKKVFVTNIASKNKNDQNNT